MFNELNKTGNQFDYVPKNKDVFKSTIEYKKSIDDGSCENTEGKEGVYPVHGYFFFTTIHGDSGAMLMEDCNVYIPKHMLSIFKGFGETENNAIKEGKLGISLYSYDSKKRADCVGVELHDI